MCERWLLLPTERCCRGDPSVLLSDSERDWDDFFFGKIVMMFVRSSLSLLNSLTMYSSTISFMYSKKRKILHFHEKWPLITDILRACHIDWNSKQMQLYFFKFIDWNNAKYKTTLGVLKLHWNVNFYKAYILFQIAEFLLKEATKGKF